MVTTTKLQEIIKTLITTKAPVMQKYNDCYSYDLVDAYATIVLTPILIAQIICCLLFLVIFYQLYTSINEKGESGWSISSIFIMIIIVLCTGGIIANAIEIYKIRKSIEECDK